MKISNDAAMPPTTSNLARPPLFCSPFEFTPAKSPLDFSKLFYIQKVNHYFSLPSLPPLQAIMNAELLLISLHVKNHPELGHQSVETIKTLLLMGAANVKLPSPSTFSYFVQSILVTLVQHKCAQPLTSFLFEQNQLNASWVDSNLLTLALVAATRSSSDEDAKLMGRTFRSFVAQFSLWLQNSREIDHLDSLLPVIIAALGVDNCLRYLKDFAAKAPAQLLALTLGCCWCASSGKGSILICADSLAFNCCCTVPSISASPPPTKTSTLLCLDIEPTTPRSISHNLFLPYLHLMAREQTQASRITMIQSMVRALNHSVYFGWSNVFDVRAESAELSIAESCMNGADSSDGKGIVSVILLVSLLQSSSILVRKASQLLLSTFVCSSSWMDKSRRMGVVWRIFTPLKDFVLTDEDATESMEGSLEAIGILLRFDCL